MDRRDGSSPLARSRNDRELDLSIRLFQNVMQALLLREIDPAMADRVQPAPLRAWFYGIAALTGIPAAVGIDTAIPAPTTAVPSLLFDPNPERLEELCLLHRALRIAVSSGRASGNDRRALDVLSAVATALRGAGLAPALTAAARRARARLRRGDAELPDLAP